MNHTRIMLYLILCGIIPLFFVGYHFISQRSSINELNEMIDIVQETALLKEKKQATNLAIRAHFRNADHFYIDKYVEPLPLLENETEALKKILNQQHLVENEAAKKRLDHLEANNHISFSEGVVQSYPYFHETTETLTRPVEIDLNDLSLILSRIEGAEIGDYVPGPNRPQLIITDFKIDKKPAGSKNETFQLNMKLIKREFF